MAGVKISQLQDGGALQSTDAFPVARGSLTRKILGARLLDPLQSLDTRLNALSANTIFVVDSPTIDLTYNSVTRTLSADWLGTSFNTVSSSTINLGWNASTRTLSATTQEGFQKINANFVAQNALSQTSVEFLSLPSWTKRITVVCDQLSLANNGQAVIQLGTSSGYEITNYQVVVATNVDNTITSSGTGSGFLITQEDMSPTFTLCGTITITNLPGTNTWVTNYMLGTGASGNVVIGSGTKTLASTLDRIRLFAGTGVGSFDGGRVNIICEG